MKRSRQTAGNRRGGTPLASPLRPFRRGRGGIRAAEGTGGGGGAVGRSEVQCVPWEAGGPHRKGPFCRRRRKRWRQWRRKEKRRFPTRIIVIVIVLVWKRRKKDIKKGFGTHQHVQLPRDRHTPHVIDVFHFLLLSSRAFLTEIAFGSWRRWDFGGRSCMLMLHVRMPNRGGGGGGMVGRRGREPRWHRWAALHRGRAPIFAWASRALSCRTTHTNSIRGKGKGKRVCRLLHLLLLFFFFFFFCVWWTHVGFPCRWVMRHSSPLSMVQPWRTRKGGE